MNQKSKKIAILYWTLFLFNFFGVHRAYLKGFKSKLYLLYLFLNAIYLILAFAWSVNSDTHDEILQVSTILIYVFLLCFQIYDYQWINRFVLKSQKQDLSQTNINTNSNNEALKEEFVELDETNEEFVELDETNEPQPGHKSLMPIIPGGLTKRNLIKLKRRNSSKSKYEGQVAQSRNQQNFVPQKTDDYRLSPTVISNDHSVGSNNVSQGENPIQPEKDQITQLARLLKQAVSGMTLDQICEKMEVKDKDLFEKSLDLEITLNPTLIQQKQNSDGTVVYYLTSND
jgi:hypothetical protein